MNNTGTSLMIKRGVINIVLVAISLVEGCGAPPGSSGPSSATRAKLRNLALITTAVIQDQGCDIVTKKPVAEILRIAYNKHYLEEYEYKNGTYQFDGWGNPFVISVDGKTVKIESHTGSRNTDADREKKLVWRIEFGDNREVVKSELAITR
jgi:hypothetical protein